MHSLPALKPEESFCFDCHPDVPCFNSCCADLDLVVSPYDALRLRAVLKIDSAEFLERFTCVAVAPDNGFPQVFLRMREDDRKTCPFVTSQGCSVYPDRPSACRSYPLGRGASLDDHGQIAVRYVMVQEGHCQGFKESKSWTPESWIQDQGLKEYNAYNDCYLGLVTRWMLSRRRMNPDLFGQVLNDLFQADDLTGTFKKVESYLLSTPHSPG